MIERRQSFSDAPLTVCESCDGGELRRVLQPVSIVFKGSGFYSTDYRNSSAYKDAAKAESGGTTTPATPAAESASTSPSSTPSTSDSKTNAAPSAPAAAASSAPAPSSD